MSKYSYSANDESLLTPVLYRFFVDPLVKVLPYRLPANFITLTSFCFILFAFGIAVHGYFVQRYDFWWAIPFLTFFYLIGDCSDGKQARRTGTGSPLGEYFDHFLDSFVTGLLMGIIMISFRVTKPAIITIGFFNLYFGQIGTFWERYKRRVIYFGKLGTSEGIVVVGLTSWLMSIQTVYTTAHIPIIFGLTGGDILIGIIMIGAAISAIHSLMRTRQISFRIIAHLILSLALTYTVAYVYTDQLIYIIGIVTFYNAFFLASLLAATNLEKREGFPDIVVPLSFIPVFLLPQYAPIIRYLQLAYLALRIAIRFSIFLKRNRQYWYWINPPPQTA